MGVLTVDVELVVTVLLLVVELGVADCCTGDCKVAVIGYFVQSDQVSFN